MRRGARAHVVLVWASGSVRASADRSGTNSSGTLAGRAVGKLRENTMIEAKTYRGACHCGDVAFEATGDMSRVIARNCSLCSRSGALLAFVPAANFKLLRGEDAQSTYTFNKHLIAHFFCKRCGIRSFAKGVGPDGAEMRAINVRCLEALDLACREAESSSGYVQRAAATSRAARCARPSLVAPRGPCARPSCVLAVPARPRAGTASEFATPAPATS